MRQDKYTVYILLHYIYRGAYILCVFYVHIYSYNLAVIPKEEKCFAGFLLSDKVQQAKKECFDVQHKQRNILTNHGLFFLTFLDIFRNIIYS